MRTPLILSALLLPILTWAAVFENPETGEKIRLNYHPADGYLTEVEYSKSGVESNYQSLTMHKTCDPVGSDILLCKLDVTLPNGGIVNDLYHNSANSEVVFREQTGTPWDQFNLAGSKPPNYANSVRQNAPAARSSTRTSTRTTAEEAPNQWQSRALPLDGTQASIAGEYMTSDADEGISISGSEPKWRVAYQPPTGPRQPLTVVSYDPSMGKMIMSHPSRAASEYVGRFFREPARPRYLEVTFPDGSKQRFYQVSQ